MNVRKLLDELFKACCIVEHDGEGAAEEPVVGVDGNAPEQYLFIFGDDACNIVHDAEVIITYNAQCDSILTIALTCPTCVDDTIAITSAQSGGIGTVTTVHLNATACRKETEDIVAINRMTAPSERILNATHVVVDHQYIIFSAPCRILLDGVSLGAYRL